MREKKRVLIACEESQTVCKEFRKKGFEAFSCDILPCSGGHPEWHIQGDVLVELNKDWDLIIAHPPCTYLTITGNKWMKPEFADRFPNRHQQRQEAIEFFMKIVNSNCKFIAVENPVGVMSTVWRKADQYVHPYHFGDPHSKKTGLWLKGLPKLKYTNIVEPQMYIYKDGRRDPIWHMESLKLPPDERQRVRSKTFDGIGQALAFQYGNFIKSNIEIKDWNNLPLSEINRLFT
jgi:site-specific DNA-cytosine methylase